MPQKMEYNLCRKLSRNNPDGLVHICQSKTLCDVKLILTLKFVAFSREAKGFENQAELFDKMFVQL